MSRPPRGLTPEEAELWAKVAATVKPLRPRARPAPPSPATVPAPPASGIPAAAAPRLRGRVPPPLPPVAPAPMAPPRPLDRHGLDASWERKLAKAAVTPDFTLDLHGHSLEAAHGRLEHGLAQALAQGARVLLLVTGRPRPSDDHAGRGERRGAIRAKVLDWLAAGPYAQRIAAVRQAHPRHGGAGALYIVLKRPGR
ncbi:Smr/MutS family protein [Novosphingobium piscinae]|uniref:Smr/MutS family protein n=1 Tax=Novosphingobium piscinae TaxID=1507448 RepID=A0A7X1FY31_9SPHN|nr:Smr/MutS family protein [Novosphingobium piscinae]MBC2669141.1 Smr/MutS family protein [Novosphingobium piscinae]